MHDDPLSLEDFSGLARLFPLPNLVLFPSVVQPLHIFEPRYRQLMADALDDDRLIAMALLQPGWEEDYHKRPLIHPVVCLGKIFQEEKLSDGRYNLLLRGVARARVLDEVDSPKLYRMGRVELIHEVVAADKTAEGLRQELGAALHHWFTAQPATQAQLPKLLESPLALGTLCDLFAFALPIESGIKQELLAEVGVESRVERLLQHLRSAEASDGQPSPARRFPPDFSSN